jgi:hypothetical protein
LQMTGENELKLGNFICLPVIDTTENGSNYLQFIFH